VPNPSTHGVGESDINDGYTIIGLVMILISLVRLITGSNAIDSAFYLSGLVLFQFRVAFIFVMVLKYGAGGKRI
jgi:hypothetical protein